MSKVIVEAQISPSYWKLPGTTAKLRIRANESFDTYEGLYVPASSNGQLYLEVPCTVIGEELLIPSFEIDSTEDSPTNPHATYTAQLFTERKKALEPEFFANFRVPPTVNTSWTTLRVNNSARRHYHDLDTYAAWQVDYKIAAALADLRKSSTTQVGMVALQDNPSDPSFPIALGPNSSQVPIQRGIVTLIAGQATALSAFVSSTAQIHLIGQDENAIGTLHIENRVTGVSFDIVSDNGADTGVVSWILYV